MNKPLVSILMTAYNREKYIAEAIASVLSSTYQNFELIIVDDCSIDKTAEIANKFASTDDRVSVYINEKNLGDYPNRNKAAGYAKGKYIKYCDSDDKLFDWTLGYCVEMMEKYPEAGMAILKLDKNLNKELVGSREAIQYNFFQNQILQIGPSGTMLRKIAFEKVGYYKADYGVPSDMYFNLKMAATFPIVLLEKEFFFYRIHDGQELNNLYSYVCYDYKYLHDALKIDDFPLSQTQKIFLLKKARQSFIEMFVQYLKKTGNVRKALKAIEISGISYKGFLMGLLNR